MSTISSQKDQIMPLKQGYSPKTISENIATELRKHPEMSPKQAAAIAYSTADEARKKAGKK